MSCSAFLSTTAGDGMDEFRPCARAVADAAKKRRAKADRGAEDFASDFAQFFIAVPSSDRLEG
jgi:hypothetical protein